MMMVQKPVHILTAPSTHRRHPSAPPAVLVQPTRIPGLLSLSKPLAQPRYQQQQQQQHQHHQTHQNRNPRSAHNKPKPVNNARQSPPPPPTATQPQHSEDLNKVFPTTRPISKPPAIPINPSPALERPPRGRQSSKQIKDKLKTRSNSQSLVRRNNNRRHHSQHHQGSPPNPSILPSQAEAINKLNTSVRSLTLYTHQHNSFDPFLVSSESDSDNPPSTPAKSNPPVRPAPKLASRPNGKLARRRWNINDVPSTPTPSKALSVPRPRGQPHSWESRPLNLSRSVPTVSSTQSGGRAMGVFPICDDLTDVEDDTYNDDGVFAPTTPVRVKGGSVTWQQSLVYDDGPRTAPLTSHRSGFPFNSKSTSTPTPERKRNHIRSPSEGVFSLSMDEDSSFSSLSDASGELKANINFSPRRRIVSATSTPIGAKKDFWASSKFQNSPNPDVLPVPAFKAQAAL
ncbi:hypothetical protein B0F90DRAFT_1718672 [Multifurca ochricompacta]|uniref:Uncharacterized protein n=1 Tax=Multifurca ochricompacta TaxID=376703 RepID=A0AAD4M5T9_9AGAM|nr:hypothetical protein B0F90DRAFT_1718672 [Multifurca ochricompacta]